MRRLLCLLLGLSACAAEDTAAPPRSPSLVSQLRAGDTLTLTTIDDAELSGNTVLDARGAADIPYCGRVVLAGLDAGEARAAIARCLVASGAYARAPELTLNVRSAAVVRVLVGSTGRDVPFETGLTVVSALAQTVAEGHAPSRVRLRRAGRTYTIDLDSILGGERADEPLEPDDVLVVKGDLPLRPPSTPPARVATPLGKRAAVTTTGSCGELLLRVAELRSEGKGDRHHEVAPLTDAMSSRCSAKDAGLAEACLDAQKRKAELLARGYGPMHPRVRAVDAALRVCSP